ncbi:MAG: hypothetical protein ACYDAH_14950 [Steroidobacteraceae bacterium]
MSIAAQSREVLIKRPDWESRTSSSPIDLTVNRRGVVGGRARRSYEQGYQAAYAHELARDSTAYSSVALNGAVNRDGDSLACAAENVARWKIYLSEECVRAMMNAGWQWST